MKLKKGDAVSIVSPASHMRRGQEHLIEQGREILMDWGLDVSTLLPSADPHYYLAGDDKHRAMEINRAIADPDIKAIFGTRGGYGCARILPLIDFNVVVNSKIFCGFSDLTSLLFAFNKLIPGITNIHGPHIATAQFIGDSKESDLTRSRLKDVLFSPEKTLVESVNVIKPGFARGPVLAGCLSILVTLIGTRYAPNYNDCILFIEDVGEKPYKIDRMITHLKSAGVFEHVRGIIYGELLDCESTGINPQQIVSELLNQYSFPVVSGFRAGHGQSNLSLRFGQTAIIDSASGKVTINENAH